MRLMLLALLLPLDVVRQLAAPQILGRFIDDATSGTGGDGPGRLVVAYFVLVVLGLGTSVLLANLTATLAWTSTNLLRDEMVASILRREPAFFQTLTPGELVDRVDNDATRLGSVLSSLLVEVAAQVLLAVGIIAALFVLDWRFGVLFLPFTAAMLALLRRQAARALPYIEAQRETEARILGAVDGWTSGAEDLRATGAVGHVRRLLAELAAREYATGRRAAAAGVRWPATVQALSVISTLSALALGVWLHQRGDVTVGVVFAALSYATLLRFPLTRITSHIQEVQTAVVSLRRVTRILGATPATPATPAAPATPAGGAVEAAREGPGDLVFDRVSFSYDGSSDVLHEVSFRLPAGSTLGVVGRTGSGKSTLIKLAFAHLTPTRGQIRLGGQDLATADRAALRRSIAYVPQGVTLFTGTLRDNLTLFAATDDDGPLVAALREAGLGALLEALPDGLDTPVDATWSGLSTGEGQMLNLARVFLTDPAVVLLDEPSSQIDPHTEQALRAALHRFARDRTAIIVSHRLETLDGADRILVLDDGRVVEHGGREDLAGDEGSVFARLLADGGSRS